MTTSSTPPNSSRTFNRWAIAALLLSLFAWAALLSPYYFTEAHDGRHSLFYQLEFFQEVADGRWYPRWGADFGFGRGYPFFIFYAPLTSYTVQAAKSWGMGVVASVKVSWALGFLLGAAGMFRLAKAWWRDDRAAFVASLLYTYVPYKFVNIYVRASIAEFWSLALFPWALFVFSRLIRRPRLKMLILAGWLYAALIFTHVGTAFLFSPLLGMLILFELAWRGYQKKPLLRATCYAGLAIVWGVLNATIFWLPLLGEQQHIDVTQYVPENYNFAIQFTEWSQFFSPFWGFGYAVEGPNDQMSFQLGILALLLTVLALWLLCTRELGRERAARLIWALISLMVIVIAMTSLAHPIWQGFPPAAMVQFPWRILGLSGILLSLIGGGSAVMLINTPLHSPNLHPAITLITLLLLYASYQYTLPRFTPPSEREETLLTILDFQREYPDMAGRLPPSQVVSQESLMEAQYEALESPQKFNLLVGEATIQQLYYGSSRVRAEINTQTSSQIELMTYDYPGWTLYVNGEKIEHRTHLPEGTIAFELPAGEHLVEARFEETPLRQLATLISLLSVGGSLVLWLWHQG